MKEKYTNNLINNEYGRCCHFGDLSDTAGGWCSGSRVVVLEKKDEKAKKAL